MKKDLIATAKHISLFFAMLPWWLMPTYAQAHNMNAPTLPVHSLTPGAILTTDTRKVCVPGYSKSVRNVPVSEKKQVYAEYKIAYVPGTREYEVDHLISLELGGSNGIKNLWPESYFTNVWNAHVKDQLENELHRRVCLPVSNKQHIDLPTAQRLISTDWISAYQSTVGLLPAGMKHAELK
jgi:hypothetical protein